MPVPPEYQRATDDFYVFLTDARDTAGLATTHQTFTMVQGVFQTFRRRVDLREAILFAGVLPPALRAVFVANWNPDESRRPFEDMVTMTKEVQALRSEHNFSPDTAICSVASALRRHVDIKAFEGVLARLSPGAVRFWEVKSR